MRNIVLIAKFGTTTPTANTKLVHSLTFIANMLNFSTFKIRSIIADAVPNSKFVMS